MFEVAWCVTLYSTVLFLEFLPVVFEKFGLHKPLEWIHSISVPLMILGVLLSTLHQSSLGTLFLIVPEKLYPLWYTPILPLLFYVSAIRGGPGDDHLRILAQQPRLRPRAGTAAAGQHGAGAGGGDERLPVDPLPGPEPSPRVPPAGAEPHRNLAVRAGDRARWLVPTVLLYQQRIRMQPGALYACAVMVVFGFIANRLNVGITGLEAGSGAHYVPQWSEVAVTLSIVAAGFAIFRMIAQILPDLRSGSARATRLLRRWKKRRRTQSRSNEAV